MLSCYHSNPNGGCGSFFFFLFSICLNIYHSHTATLWPFVFVMTCNQIKKIGSWSHVKRESCSEFVTYGGIIQEQVYSHNVVSFPIIFSCWWTLIIEYVGFCTVLWWIALLCTYSFYLKARDLAPKDGRPYNQLAVVALNTVKFQIARC